MAFKKQHVYIYRQNLAGMRQYNLPIHNIKPLEQNRKALRNNMTPAEVVLWKAIQKGKLEGRKFRRQHSVGKYVLDFYCPVELDVYKRQLSIVTVYTVVTEGLAVVVAQVAQLKPAPGSQL